MWFDWAVVLRLTAGALAVLALFLPSDLLRGLAVDAEFQIDLLRFMGAVVAGWAGLDLLVRYQRLEVPVLTQVLTIAGFGLLIIGLVGPNMAMMFLSFSLLTASMLATAMVLADAWRDSVFAAHERRGR